MTDVLPESPRDASGAGEARPRNEEAPAVGRVGRWLGDYGWTGSFWMKASLRAALLPGPIQWAVVHSMAIIGASTMGEVRRTLARNHTWARGRRVGSLGRWRDAARSLRAFAWCLIERNESLVPARWARFEHEYEGTEHWHASGADQGAAILLTAHVGGWEVGSLRPVAELGRRLHLVREEERTEALQATFAAALEARGDVRYVTHFAARNPDLGLELLEALQAGDLVALQGDRPRADGDVVEVELFGRPHRLPAGPFVLARMTGAPVLPVFTLRRGRRRYEVRLHGALTAPRTRNRAADHRALATAYARLLEDTVRRHPEQWFRFGGESLEAHG